MASFKELINGELPVLIDFSAEWCGPCQMLKPELENFADKVKGKVRVLKIDIDKNQPLAQQYRVQGVPTLMLFDKGNMLWRGSGYMTAGQMEEIIQTNLPK